jgi:predicted nucleic acid-binding protein
MALLQEYREGRAFLIAPDHIRYEVANAIRVASRTNRLTAEQGRLAMELFLSWKIPTTAVDDLILMGYETSQRLNCSLYDGLYLALAGAANCHLIYADKRLRNLIQDKFPLSLWIGDYSVD